MNYLNSLLILFLLGCLPATGFTQLEKTLHQTFPIFDAELVRVDLAGDYVLESWAGNEILTETNVSLFNASPGVLKHFLETGRYDILTDSTSADGYMALQLYSADMERKDFKTSEGTAHEVVRVKVYIPREYRRINDQEFQKIR